jgi:hypothetical protein
VFVRLLLICVLASLLLAIPDASSGQTASPTATPKPEPTPKDRSPDPPLLGKWYGTEGAMVFSMAYHHPLEQVELVTPLGKVKSTQSLFFVQHPGMSVTSWLEIGGTMALGGNQYQSPDPLYSGIGSFGLYGGPFLRPYLRFGHFRVWGYGAYVFGTQTFTFNYKEDADRDGDGVIDRAPEGNARILGPVYGAGVDVGFGRKGAFVLRTGIDLGQPYMEAKVKRVGRVEGEMLAPTRIVFGVGAAL